MSDKVEHCQIDEFTDDSLAYDKAQAGVQTDDPLAAIKKYAPRAAGCVPTED